MNIKAIIYRILISSLKVIYGFIFQLFSFFTEIDEHLIMLSSYNHNKISCNPKYIEEYIKDNNFDFKVVWILRRSTYNICKKDKKSVRFAGFKYIYMMSKAKFIISNQRTEFLVPKRRNQIYIQTWHSSVGMKQIEAQASDMLSYNYKKLAKEDSKKTNYMVSGSRFNTKRIERYFWYKGDILNIGTPRNDIFFDTRFNFEKIKDEFGLHGDPMILLYAPTFRENKKFDYFTLNFDKVLNFLEELTDRDWVLFYRLHPNLTDPSKNYENSLNSLNVSHYDDIQEILVATDLLITDYSSIMFDFMLTKKPIFLYAPDVEEYLHAERRLNFTLNDLPFSLSQNTDELLEKISAFDENEYLSNLNLFFKRIGVYEEGTASKQLVELMMKERGGISE